MKQLIILLLSTLLFNSFEVKCQGSFQEANHTYKIIHDSLIVYQTAYFGSGSPSVCPPLDSANFQINDDTITLFVR